MKVSDKKPTKKTKINYISKDKACKLLSSLALYDIKNMPIDMLFSMLNNHWSTKKNNLEYNQATIIHN